MRWRTAKRVCFCDDCIRCGCAMWERHHRSIRYTTPLWYIKKRLSRA